MRALIQRVTNASVYIDGKIHSQIKGGLLVLLGIEKADSEEAIHWLSAKIINLRIFDDVNGIMNLSLKETGGELMLVSQFTLHAVVKKGNRPSYQKAARPELALPLYEKLRQQLETDLGKKIATGEFGAMMKIELVNDGPVTIWIDTGEKD